MRTKALILLIPFVVFITETASVLPPMKQGCAIAAMERSACCMQEDMDEEQACPIERSCDKKDPVKSCENNPDCTTCPVCYTFIVQPQFEWQQSASLIIEKNYSLPSTGNISSYTNDVWKPPNGFSCFI